jgi:tetratricopeptide (TPR) repeat protein
MDGRLRLAGHFPSLLAAALLALVGSSCVSFDSLLSRGMLDEADTLLQDEGPAQKKDGYSRLGAAYEGKGDYERAFAYYLKGDDQSGLRGIEGRLFKSGAYDLYLQGWKELRKTLVLSDDFKDNAKGWNVRADDYGRSEIGSGKLAFLGKANSGASYFWPSTPSLGKDDGFKVEATFTRIAGSDEDAIDLAWGLGDASNCYLFGVAGNGNFDVVCQEKGQSRTLIAWTSSEAIKRGLASNKLAVQRDDEDLSFYINDAKVGSTKYEVPPQNGIGLAIDASLSVDVEGFRIERYPAAQEAWNEVGGQCLSSGDLSAAIKYYALAGNAEALTGIARIGVDKDDAATALAALEAKGLSAHGARLKLAAMLGSAGRTDEALGQLKVVGWSFDNSLSRQVLSEDFSNNDRGWSSRNDGNAVLAVHGGAYIIESGSPDGWSSWITSAINPEADFKIEAKLREVSGPGDKAYSVIWGFQDANQSQSFGVTGDGGFEYGYFDKGSWNSALKSDACPAVRRGGAENDVAVVRSGDTMRFLVNGCRVGEAPFRPFLGDCVGFSTDGAQAIEAKSLSICEYPPESLLGLVKDLAFQGRPQDYLKAESAMRMDKGDYEAALADFARLGDAEGARTCNERLAYQAAASGDAAKAVESYLKAGPTEFAYRGLVASYLSLGQADKARSANASLADLLFGQGRRDEALAIYQGLADHALLGAAALRYYAVQDYPDAAALFKAAGNGPKEKECYGLIADGLAKSGDSIAAVAMYRKAGNEPRALGLEKKIVAPSPLPLVPIKWSDQAEREEAQKLDSFLRVVDSGGISVDVSDPEYEDAAPNFLKAGAETQLDLDRLASASFDWAKGKAAVTTIDGERLALAVPEYGIGEVRLMGAFYVADIRCEYRILLTDVKSISRLEAGPIDAPPRPQKDYEKFDCRIVDKAGVARELTDAEFLFKGAFDTPYTWSIGGMGPAIQAACLDPLDALGVDLGKGSYDVPLDSLASISLKDKTFVSAGGLHCPAAGAAGGLIAVVGETPRGRMAIYASSISELEISAIKPRLGAEDDSLQDDKAWTADCATSTGAKPFLSLADARCEIYSPEIDWRGADSVLAFRAALDDYREAASPTADRSGLFNDKTYYSKALPIAIGDTYMAVPFRLIKEFGLDAKGNLSITMLDGSALKGLPYKNWRGLVDGAGLDAYDSSQGGKTGSPRLDRQKIPAHVALR